jgi:hypothetical protein
MLAMYGSMAQDYYAMTWMYIFKHSMHSDALASLRLVLNHCLCNASPKHSISDNLARLPTVLLIVKQLSVT